MVRQVSISNILQMEQTSQMFETSLVVEEQGNIHINDSQLVQLTIIVYGQLGHIVSLVHGRIL